MDKNLWSFAAIEATDKSNYLVCTRDDEKSPHIRFEINGSNMLAGPETLLPWGRGGYIFSTKTMKAKLEDRAIKVYNLRRKNSNFYQVGLPITKKNCQNN